MRWRARDKEGGAKAWVNTWLKTGTERYKIGFRDKFEGYGERRGTQEIGIKQTRTEKVVVAEGKVRVPDTPYLPLL